MAGFHPLTVTEVRRETADAVSVRFAVPASLAEAFRFRPGQHLTLRREIAGQEVRRNYSICAAPQDGELRIAIKRIEGGIFSGWANDALAAGTTLEVMPPHGSFTWRFDPARSGRYLGIAGGSGITPILSLLKSALASEPTSRFTLLYGNRDSGSIIFLEALAALKNRFMARLEVLHFLEREEDEVELFNGRLDAGKLAEVLPEIEPAGLTAAFICGPGPMMEAAEQALRGHGLPRDRILIERYTAGRPAGAAPPPAQPKEGREVTATLEGRRRRFHFDAAQGSLLDSARAAGLAVPFACKAGVCATCRARLVGGRVQMAANFALTAEEIAQGYVLACQSVPLTDDVALDFDL